MAKYLAEERETILNYDPTTRTWSAWTNVPEHIRKLQAKGWTINPNRCTVSEGVMIDAWFTAPKNAITFRDLTKPKRVGNAAFIRSKTAETEPNE